jgi:hypothetical protein
MLQRLRTIYSPHSASRGFLPGLMGPYTQPDVKSTSDVFAQHPQYNAVGALIVTPEASEVAGAVSGHRRRSRSVDVPLQEATDTRAHHMPPTQLSQNQCLSPHIYRPSHAPSSKACQSTHVQNFAVMSKP